MRIALLIFCFVIGKTSGYSQDIAYVKDQAKILSDSKMYGRGYVKNGMQKSAKHIASEFKRMGLKTFQGSYHQKYQYTVNTFPKKISLLVNNKELVAGKDYLLAPESGSSQGEYKLIKIGIEELPSLPNPANLPKNTAILLDSDGIQGKDSLSLFYQLREDYGGYLPVFWVEYNRLVWSVARREMPNAVIEVNPGLLSNGDMVKLKIRNKLIQNFKTSNVMGYVPGTLQPDSFMVITAHYDHLGMMGKEAAFLGANDNASGVAFLLSMARYYQENPSKYSVMFIAFSGEEAGLKGSKYYTQNPVFNLNKIKFLMNLDLLGYGEGGITVVNGSVFQDKFDRLVVINNQEKLLSKIKRRGKAANSDHYWFSEAGVPSFFIYTMGDNQAYHDIFDRYSNLTFGEYEDIFRLLTTFIKTF